MFTANKDTHLLYALGVLSHKDATQRSWIRASWGSPEARARAMHDHRLLLRFVLRGIGASEAHRVEALKHRDIVFVPAPASAGRAVGPLISLVLWWRHALAAWPQVLLIGKADDDVYLHLPGIAQHLAASLATVRRTALSFARPRLYWGAFESYSMDVARRAPIKFDTDHPSSCLHDNVTAGPFPFARGPLYFVDASLVQSLLADAWVASELNATLAALTQRDEMRRDATRAKRGTKFRLPPMVWEDVMTGYLLSRAVSKAPGLALVENGFGNGQASATYADGWGMQLAPTTLVWHMRTKRNSAHRVAFAHRWLELEERHCAPTPSSGALVRCGRYTARASTTSCTGARWLRCTSYKETYDASNCSRKLFELKREAHEWWEQQQRRMAE